MKIKRYNNEISAMKDHRKNNAELDKDRIKLKTDLLPVHQEINMMLRNYQKLAEQIYLSDKPDIQEAIRNAQEAKAALKTGDVEGAAKIQSKDLNTRKIINYGN